MGRLAFSDWFFEFYLSNREFFSFSFAQSNDKFIYIGATDMTVSVLVEGTLRDGEREFYSII